MKRIGVLVAVVVMVVSAMGAALAATDNGDWGPDRSLWFGYLGIDELDPVPLTCQPVAQLKIRSTTGQAELVTFRSVKLEMDSVHFQSWGPKVKHVTDGFMLVPTDWTKLKVWHGAGGVNVTNMRVIGPVNGYPSFAAGRVYGDSYLGDDIAVRLVEWSTCP